MTKRLVILSTFMSTVLFFDLAGAQESTSGMIEGTVKNDRGAALAGVTVTLNSAQGTKSTTTDADGAFRFPALTAGTYSLRAMQEGYSTSEQPDLQVRIGSRLRVAVEMTAGNVEKVTVLGSASTVDLSATAIGTTINSDMMSSLPIGRTFASTLALAPGVVGSGIDESNPSIAGASGLENTYVVDGVNINNTGYGSNGSYSIVLGSLGTGVNFDYIEEIQVKTGGYEPEYGETLGGYINMVTKTGGNEHRGSAFVYGQGSGMEGNRQRDDRIDAESDETGFSSTDFGVELGGPIQRDKVFYYGAFDPTFLKIGRQSAESTGFNHEVDVEREIYNYAGNVKWLASPKHTITLSAFGDPSKGKMGPQREDAVAIADPTLRHSEITYGGNNGVARWNGELNENTFIEASFAYHTDKFEETLGVNQHRGIDRTGIVSGDTLGPTPPPPTSYGGVGFFSDSKSTNAQYRVKFSNYFQGQGEHNLRFGIDFQDIGYDNTANYSGPPGTLIPESVENFVGLGSQAAATGFDWDVVVDSTETAPGSGVLVYPSGRRFRLRRVRTGQITTETANHALAFFVSDTWRPVDWVSIMAGVRYEENTLIGDVSKFSWNNNWGPRFHLTVDPTKDNRSKISFAYGRFFGKIPNDLAVRALGTEITHIVSYDAADVNFSDPHNPVVPDPSLAKTMLTFGNVPTVVDPNSKVTYQDEFVVIGERDVIPHVSAGVTYTHRRLGRTLEDVALVPYSDLEAVGLGGTSDFGEYFITNPEPTITFNGQVYENMFPKPSRKYHAVTFKAEKRYSVEQPWRALGSYTWSQLKGNYEGYFRRDNGQSDPFITSLFDFPYLRDPDIFRHLSADGLLPNDRQHVFNLFGSYTWATGLTLGSSLRVQTGIPVTPLGHNLAYGDDGEIPLEERGSRGRTPTTTDIGLHADYAIQMGTRQVEVIADVFNILNQQKGSDYDLRYEVGGSGTQYNSADFGKPNAYERPLSFRFALRAVQ
jgi:outer membrane receptor for ferrienterochelin and colicin